MGDSWHAVLRDIMVILAAGSLISFLLFAAIAIWQLYRLALEVRDESRPILDSVLDTTESVKGAAQFVTRRTLPPAVTGVGLTAGAAHAYRQLGAFYRGLRPVTQVPPPPGPSANGAPEAGPAGNHPQEGSEPS